MRAIGLRVRSGVAIAAVLEGSVSSWRVTECRKIELCPPEGHFARFPYHPLIELDEQAGAAASRQAVQAIRRVAAREMHALLGASGALEVAGIVGGSLVDPNSLRSAHMRAHALEGRLYREVVESGLQTAGITARVFSDRDLLSQLALRLGLSMQQLAHLLTKAGRGTFKPWSSHEKLATAGALTSSLVSAA
jgi:hypothetical protein